MSDMSVDEVARYLFICPVRVRQLLEPGELLAVPPGVMGDCIIDAASVSTYRARPRVARDENLRTQTEGEKPLGFR
jgi:hypothetical protein